MKKNITLRLLSLFAATALCVSFTSCKDKNDATAFSVSTNVVILSSDAQNYSITVNAPEAWSIASDAEWCSANPNSGKAGAATIQLAVLENTSGATRVARLTARCGSATQNIVVSQKTTSGGGGGGGTVEASDVQANKWIFTRLSSWYYWNTELKTVTPDYNQETNTFFENLLLGLKTNTYDGKTKDGQRYIYSFMQFYKAGGYNEEGPDISSEYRTPFRKVKPMVTRATTYNYTFGFGFEYTYIDENNTIGGIVLYVIPGSGAEKAGLKRGDFIKSYTNAANKSVTLSADLDNYQNGETSLNDYLSDPSQLSNSLKLTMSTGSAITVAATQILAGPIICHKTITTTGGKKVGYLMYNEFVSGQDEHDYSDETYNDALKTIFAGFKSDGVTEFVLDLRYNGGGELYCSQILSSMLVTSNKLGTEYGHLKYNSEKSSQNSSINFLTEVASQNLNLSKVYVIGSDYTASASEMVISGLRGADVNVVLLGTQTEGKNVGMDGFYKEFGDYGYEMWPITFQIYNAKNFTDYANGFTPDYKIDEWDYAWYELGDSREVLLGAALDVIDGKTPQISATRSMYGSRRAAKTLPAKGLINHRYFE